MRLVAEPLIPMALWIALALLVLVTMVWYGWTSRMPTTGWRRASIVGLMSLTAALPLMVLLNLTWIQSVPPPAGKPVVRVIVDTSASMLTDDVDGKSRLSAAQAIAKDLVTDLEDRFDVRVETFDHILKTSDLASLQKITSTSSEVGNESNLAVAIASAVKEDVPQGQSILLLSDGIHNVGAVRNVLESATQAQAMDVPVFAATLGGKVGVKNVSVTPRSPQELAFVGQTIPTTVNVQATGVGGRPISVSLWKDDAEIKSVEVRTDESDTAEASFEVTEMTPGLYRYEVRAEEIIQEATTADNRATILYRVVDRPIKMLLVEGKPYWDTKFLVRRLAADQSLELTSVIRMAEGRYLKRTMAQATGSDERGSAAVEQSDVIHDGDAVLSADSLTEVQIVVLGRDAECFLSDDALDALRNWISRDGGSLVCARGAPEARVSQRLGQILPVRWTVGRENRFRVAMTSQGKELRWLGLLGDQLGTMPSLATVAGTAQPQGLASVLAATVDPSDEGETVPVISWQPYGSGRTVVVEGAGMWRWALMAPKYSQQEEVYSTLWRSLLRWLVARAGLLPGQNLSLQPDRVSFEAGNVATATMLVRTEAVSQVPRVRLRGLADSEDGKPFDQEYSAKPVGHDPGVYRFDFGKLPSGQYAAQTVAEADELLQAKTAFDVRDRWIERLELDARPDVMQRIAQQSGGAVLAQADSVEFAEQFQDHLTRARAPQYRRVTMWDRWWVLSAVFVLWASTWVLRRRSGLV